jgi:RNA polymerase sigma-70 factor (ECF subfamily)
MDASTSPETRFASLIEAHRAILYKVAYFYCRDAEERRDLIQDIGVELWRAFDSFSGQSKVSTWIYRVAMNVAISHRRREGRRIRDTLPLDLGLEVADTAFAADDPQSRLLHALIDGLDEMSRALVLLYLEGFSHADIAETLGTSPSNVSTRLNRIKIRLQSAAKEQTP